MSSKYFRSSKGNKLNGLLASEQLKKIKTDFPELQIVKNTWNSFQLIIQMQPTSISAKYDIKIVYELNRWVKVFVINMELRLAPNRVKLPHVYDTSKQQLCLYSPSKKEWDGFKYIADTIIPWTSDWLYYYELWLPEGKWYGGGHNEYPNEENTRLLKNE
ncbi:hypothetical protein ED312_08810 [Sinomicrobium pectinilyticum]|uniref:Type II CBASS E2 protein domain-containing protein n=1 Tax=Sinomicrobium pectinilyticum TaxID=1084421 RepID=A0A3N0ELB9_SINP1|nr:hypothetical protein [Sinomicrobium pectinilyticum]RNL88537.1 hypothetical protein ED312_08810 [Sinomicrobium pectinilyticum]